MTESQLYDVIKESVKKILHENERCCTPYYIKMFHEKYGGVRGAARLFLISNGKNEELGQALTDYAIDLNFDNTDPRYMAQYIIKNYPKIARQ